MRTQNCIINDQQVSYYLADGFSKARPIVFLHGWASSADIFRGIWSEIPNWIALDWPGFGRSELPRVNWSLDEYARFLQAWITKMDLTDPILVGHSFGGSVILAYCNFFPNASQLILIGSAGIRRKTVKKKTLQFLSDVANAFLLILPSRPRQVVKGFLTRHIGSPDYLQAGQLRQTFVNIIGQDLRPILSNIKNQTTLIWGDRDWETPVADGKLMQRLLPNATLHVIPNAGHYCFLDNQKSFIDAFKQALS